MLAGSTALVLLALGAQQPTLHDQAPRLRLTGDSADTPWTLDLRLRTSRVALDDAPPSVAQRSRRHRETTPAATPAAAAQPATGAAPAAAAPPAEPAAAPPAEPAAPPAEPPAEAATPAEGASGEAASGEAPEQCDIDCETARESDRHARYVFRQRGRVLRTHRAFGIAAWSTMLVTEALGTILLINQDTWFSRGACQSNPNAFGCYQNSLITGMHLGFAFATTTLYTTAGVIAATAPDPEGASEGDDAAPRTLRRHKWLAWVHGAGMVLLPILGIVSTHPQIFGINDEAARADFTRATRSMHMIIGYSTFAALTWAGILEL